MNALPIEIRQAQRADFDAVVALLRQGGLPTRDLAPEAVDGFLVAADTTSASIVGAVALERYGAIGLLRSLVVAPAWRGRGVGEALVAAIELRARETRTERIGLLTETAAAFFRRAGYRAVERDAAPEALRTSSQFASVCPASAAYMEKSLAGAAATPAAGVRA